AAERVVAQLDLLGAGAPFEVLSGHAILDLYAEKMLDTARMRQEAAQVLALSQALPDTIRQGLVRDERSFLKGAIMFAERNQALLQDSIISNIGRQPAAPLAGEYWFGRRQETGQRPTRGKVALVVFAPSNDGERSQKFLFALSGDAVLR